MKTKIEPALTPEEWAIRKTRRRGVWFEAWIAHGGDQVLLAGPHDGELGAATNPKERHALAALCLHGQPFGFTHADVDKLYAIASGWDRGEPPALSDLADRIEALLPPREP